ncbi:MAG TPA: MarR family transcriptional regulator [Actinomycetes bacterium]|jgi:predicted transcriptional regulator|nr:MarR family transcriptional regulator [Actinomycetes bacterium]
MRHTTRPAPDEAEVRRVIERLAGRFVEAGMARMPARVFVAVLVSPEGALTAAEIAELLKVSPAAVSNAVKVLTQTRLIDREYVPGSRRDLYRTRQDSWAEAMAARSLWMKWFAETATESIDALGGEDSPAGARLADLRDYFVFAQSEVTAIFGRWRAQGDRTRPRPG